MEVMMLTRLPVRFTEQDAADACEAWGFNCGPAAIAAICGLTPSELRPHLGDFERKRYTNPTLMFEILRRLSVRYSLEKGSRPGVTRWPSYGLARIQWEGPWMNGSVPAAARYRHTHWVGASIAEDGQVGIFDVHCLNNGTGWVALADWRGQVVPFILRECHPRANGFWHITHALELEVAR
jgi:hypothetical protein